MRVLIVRTSAYLTTLERMLLWLARELRPRGIEVGIAAIYRRPSAGPDEHPLVAAAHAAGFPAWSIPDRGALAVGTLRGLAHVVRSFRPNLVHTHDYKADVLAGLFIPRGMHLATAHGFTDADQRQRVYRVLDVRLLRRLPRVIVPSRHMAQVLTGYGLATGRVWVIPHGLDWSECEGLAQDVAGVPARACVFVGRFSPEKGGDLFLRALAQVREEVPAVRGIMVGDGPAQPAWQVLARELGLDGVVHFPGWVANPFPWLARGQVAVVPSRREAFGLVAVEAQGVGTPVVAGRVGGLPEVVAPGGGVLVPPGDVDALAQAVVSLLATPERVRSMGARARKWVRTHFRLEEMVDAHVGMYEELTHRGGV